MLHFQEVIKIKYLDTEVADFAISDGKNRKSLQDDSAVVDDHEDKNITASYALYNDFGLSSREISLIKSNEIIACYKNYNHNHRHSIYALHPGDYLHQIIVIDFFFSTIYLQLV